MIKRSEVRRLQTRALGMRMRAGSMLPPTEAEHIEAAELGLWEWSRMGLERASEFCSASRQACSRVRGRGGCPRW